ncbi:hypothetical protein COI93_07775 [Bacillus cereus]|uniref:Uncharacterized protein n=1 Tax=Bacillus cereus TaxID=1396 RepID=A0A2B0MXN0_BACCE|nr:hypothetical protein COI93_07775 [Bacillus cereus]
MLDNFLEGLVTILNGIPLGTDQYPTEEKISDNIKRLRNEQWFKPMFAEHMTLFLENYDIRLVIGVAKLDIILANEKKRKDFADTLAYLITIKSKKAK